MTTEDFAKSLSAKAANAPKIQSKAEELLAFDTFFEQAKALPANIYDEIAFMLGSTEYCHEVLADLLIEHGYTEENFGWIDANDDPEIVMAVYHKFFEGK